MKLVGGVSSATVRRGTNPPLLPPHIPNPETAILEEDISHNQWLLSAAHTPHVSTANWDAFSTFSTMDLTNQNSEPTPCCQSPMFEFEFKYTTQNARFEPTNQIKLNYNPQLSHSEPPDDQTTSPTNSAVNSAANLELFLEELEQDAHSFQGAHTIPAADPMSHCHDNRIADKDLESKSLVDLESEESNMPEILSGKTAGRRILKPLTSVPEDYYCPSKKPKWSSTSSKDSFNLAPQTDQSDSSICSFNQSNCSTSEVVLPIAGKLKPLLSFPSESQIETDHSVRTQSDQSDSPPQSGDQFKSLPVCSTEKNSQQHGMHMAHKSSYVSMIAHSANRELLVQSHYGGKNSQSLPVCDAENKCRPHRIHMTHRSSQDNIVAHSINLEPSLWQNYEGIKSINLPVGSHDNSEQQHGMDVAHSVSPESSVWAHDDRKNSQDDIVSDLLLDSLSEGSDPHFFQCLDDSLWDIQIDQLDEFPGESSQSDSSVMHRRKPQFAAAFDQSDSRVRMQTNQAALSHSTLTNQSDPSVQFQLQQSDFRSIADPQPRIGKRKVTPALMRKSKRAFNCPYTQSTVQEETHTSANVVAQPAHSRSSRGTFRVPLQTSGGVGSFAPEGSGSESPMCGSLRFPSCAEVSSSPTPHRHTVIPHSFTSAHQYRQMLTIAIRGMCRKIL